MDILNLADEPPTVAARDPMPIVIDEEPAKPDLAPPKVLKKGDLFRRLLNSST